MRLKYLWKKERGTISLGSKTPPPLRGGVGGRVITFGDNRINNHPHPVSPPQGGGNKAVLF
jgi:hypothetical protein